LVGLLGIPAAQLLRQKEKQFRLLCPHGSPAEAEAIDLMVQYPALMERPIVVCGDSAVIARPPEKLQELLRLTDKA
jgi:arsenate reductase